MFYHLFYYTVNHFAQKFTMPHSEPTLTTSIISSSKPSLDPSIMPLTTASLYFNNLVRHLPDHLPRLRLYHVPRHLFHFNHPLCYSFGESHTRSYFPALLKTCISIEPLFQKFDIENGPILHYFNNDILRKRP